MPTFQDPRSLIAQFPEEIYQNAGTSAVLLRLMKCIDADKVLAVQFLRAGRVRLTFEDPELCSGVLLSGLDFDGLSIRLTPADSRLGTVYLRDLPVVVYDDAVSSFFSEYGEALSIDHC